ncbi:MAG: hypothetical protein WDN69_15965 [Aliidongia sp.]
MSAAICPSALQLSANTNAAADGALRSALGEFFYNGGGYPFVFDAAGNTSYGVASPTINEPLTPEDGRHHAGPRRHHVRPPISPGTFPGNSRRCRSMA